jgi:hypothetical protein
MIHGRETKFEAAHLRLIDALVIAGIEENSPESSAAANAPRAPFLTNY